MAFVVKDRIKETTTTTGTGTYTLAGAAIGGYNTFAEIGTGNTTYYACTDGTDWEVGLGTYTASGTTLSRDQIIESSNSNSAVNWGSGSKDIFVTLPSSKALVMDDNDEFNVNGGDAIRFGADQASSFSRMSLSINGSVGALGMSEPSAGNSTLNLTAQNLRGIGDGGDIHFLGSTTGAGSSIQLYGGNSKVFETSRNGAGASVTGNLSVSGDLTVNGTTTTVNSTTVTIDDPVFTLGGDTAPASDDNKDRGIEFRWHDGSAAKLGFFGYDDSEGKLTFIPDATNTSEVFSGSVGTILANVEGTLTGNADTASAADFLTGLADPDADRLLMWDDSASGHAYVTVGSNLSLSGTTLTSTDTTYSAGTGLSLTGTTFANTAPDQTVTLTGSGATSISGTYPSFTISSTNTTYSAGTGLSLSGTTFTNTAPDQTVTLTGSGATSISGTYPSFTISSTDTNTTYSASTGLNLSGTTFSIDTSVVPQLSTDNEFSGSIYLQEDEEFAFYNSSNSVMATLTQDATTDLLTLQNHNERVDIKGNNGVRLWHDDTTTDNFGVHVYETSGNVFGALCFNGSEKIVTNGSGVSVVGSLNTTSSATVSGDLTVDSGVLYASSTLNRVGINTTSPTGALEITQTANVSPWGESGIKINNSTGSQFAGIGFRSTFGLYISAGAGTSTDNEIRFITSDQGTEGIRMTIDSNGSVGIGTTSPSEKLHVVGNIHVEGNIERNGGTTQSFTVSHGNSTTDPAMTFWGRDHGSYAGQVHIVGRNSNASASSGDIQMWNYNGSSWFNLFNFSYDTDNSDTRATIETGTDVNTAIMSKQSMYFIIDSENDQNDRSFFFGHNADRPGAATQLMTIKEDGKVGIGTTNPSQELHVHTTASSNADVRITGYNQTSTYMDVYSGTTSSGLWVAGSSDMRLGTNNTTRLTINTLGNVGIGTTSPSALLNLSGTGVANLPTLAIDTSSTSTFVHSQENFAANLGSGSTNLIVIGKEGSTKNSGYLGFQWASAGSNSNFVSIGHWAADHLFRVYADGTLKAGTNTIWHQGNDGSGSGLDADLLDGQHGSYYTGAKGTNQNYVASSSSTSNRGSYGAGVWAYSGYSSGTNRPHTYDATIQVMPAADRGFEISADWLSQTSTPLKVRSLRDCCQGWSDWTTIWTSSTDGAGSGLDADLWDGNQFSSYLNQAVLTTSSPTFSSVGVNNAAWIRDITGQYGSIEIDGAATGGYEGYSIGGRAVFMHDNSTQTGIYNDVNNQWILRATHNNMTALYYAGSEKMRTLSTGIQVNGTVSIVSDRNLKENIKPIDSSLMKLEQITGYSFDYKDSGGKGHGIIAQELEEIIPDAVQVNDEGFKQVDYNSVIALLINAVKELNEKVQELESNANTYTG